MAAGKLVQYKILTEPVYVPAGVAEDVTVDKWFQLINQPVLTKSKLRQADWLFEPVLVPELPAWITVDSWLGFAVNPVRVERQFTQQEFVEPFTAAFAVPAETITLDKWYQPLSLPVRRPKAFQNNLEPPFLPLVSGIVTPTVTLDDLFCNRNLVSLSDFQSFIVDFDAVAVNSHQLSVADFEFLDYDQDKSLVFDRDIWLHKLLIQKGINVGGRLSFPDNSDSDPLGIATNKENTIIIDQDNPNSVKIRSGNTVTAQDGGSPLIPSLGTTGLLWNSTSDTTYNYVLWYQFLELDETGSSSTRRFPHSGIPITVYIRGGEQLLPDGYVSIIKNTATLVDNSKIIIRAYPGETAEIHFAVTHASAYAIGFTRPFCSLRDLVLYGWSEVGSGNDRTYSPKFVSLGGEGCSIINCELRECAGIDPTDPDAATYPTLVDQGWATRGGSNSSAGRLVQIFSDGFLLKGSYFEYAPLEFPWDGVSYSGEGLDIREHSINGIVCDCELEGFVPHSQIRLQGTYTLIERNHFGSGGDINILVYGDTSTLGGHHNTIRYNRLHAWNTVNPAVSAGNNIQGQGMHDCEIYGNVIWGTESIDGRGIVLSNNPTGLDLDCYNNLVYNNLIYHGGIFLGYTGGRPASGTNKIYDNSIYANALVDFTADHKSNERTNGTLYINLDSPLVNNGYGNIIYDNIIIRDDAVVGKDIVVRLPGDTYNHYVATDTVGTWIYDNLDDDPLWTDAENGDFTLLSGSPVTWLDGNEPLTEWVDASEAYTCEITIDHWGQPANEPVLPKPKPWYVESSVNPVESLPHYYRPIAEILTDFQVLPVLPRQPIAFLEPAYWYGILTDIPANPVEPEEPAAETPTYPTVFSAIYNTFDIDI